jgi:hypothetical protein
VKREAALVVFAFACLSAIATFPLVLHLGRALPGDLGDPLFSSWVLGWDAERLRHGLKGIWDAPILFPSRYTLAFAEHLLGIAIFVAPVIWVSGNPILAYDVAFLLTFVLAGCGMYLLARELSGRRDAAFLAGLAFACSPMRALHVSHLQVLAWGWMPIALWGLHRYFSRRSTAALAIFAARSRSRRCRTATSSTSGHGGRVRRRVRADVSSLGPRGSAARWPAGGAAAESPRDRRSGIRVYLRARAVRCTKAVP